MWSALESEEAHQEVLKGLVGLEGWVGKKIADVQRSTYGRHEHLLGTVREASDLGEESLALSKKTAKAVKSLTTTAATKFLTLEKRVEVLSTAAPQMSSSAGLRNSRASSSAWLSAPASSKSC